MHDRKREELSEAAKKQLQLKIATYKDLCEKCLALRRQKVYTADALKLLDKIVMVNPDFYTMWNYRKEILMHMLKENTTGENVVSEADATWTLVEKDLAFSAQVIEQRDHKSYCTWYHRRWLLGRFLKNDEKLSAQLGVERKLCEKALKVDDRNFHCWGYRGWVVEQLRVRGSYRDTDEMAHAQTRVEANFSNYSAWHARSRILQKTEENSGDRDAAVAEELELVQNAMYTEPADQSGWIYALWLVTQSSDDAARNQLLEYSTELLDDDATLKWPRLAKLATDTSVDTSAYILELIANDPMRRTYYQDLMKC